MSESPITYDHKTGYWIGPEIPWAGPKVLLVELPDPTPQAGWPPDDSCFYDESPAEAGLATPKQSNPPGPTSNQGGA